MAALIAEPIQAEGGDPYGSPAFFQGLRDITKKSGIVFIVDEVQTGGGASGEMWAHSHWNLSTPPDIVTFSKKMLTGGYFYADHLKVKEGYRIYNTWVGDPTKLFLLGKVMEVVKRDNLIQKAKEVGQLFQKSLAQLQVCHPPRLGHRYFRTLIRISSLRHEDWEPSPPLICPRPNSGINSWIRYLP